MLTVVRPGDLSPLGSFERNENIRCRTSGGELRTLGLVKRPEVCVIPISMGAPVAARDEKLPGTVLFVLVQCRVESYRGPPGSKIQRRLLRASLGVHYNTYGGPCEHSSHHHLRSEALLAISD